MVAHPTVVVCIVIGEDLVRFQEGRFFFLAERASAERKVASSILAESSFFVSLLKMTNGLVAQY